MMTRNTSKRRAQYRLLLLLPMMSGFIWCCTKSRPNIAVDIKDAYAMQRGIKLAYNQPTANDTLVLKTDSNDPSENIIISIVPTPVRLNNQEILKPQTITKQQCINPGPEFGMKYIIDHTNMERSLQRAVDGVYRIMVSDIIIDATGHIVYYRMNFPQNNTEFTHEDGYSIAKPSGLTDKDNQDIQKEAAALLIAGNIEFKPFQNAPYYLNYEDRSKAFNLTTIFTVKNHKVSYVAE
jgi:hypothetical protein